MNKRSNASKNNLYKIIAAVSLVIIVLALIAVELGYEFTNPNKTAQTFALEDNNIAVHFIDVGQGDCEIIQTKNMSAIIDSGESTAKDTVLSYIKSLGIKRFDYVIATHPHSDHIGTMDSIINNFQVGTVIMPKLENSLVPITTAYESLLNAINAKGLKIHSALPDETYDLDGATLKILAPINDYDELNDYSVVCKLTYGERSFLFTGDAQNTAEADIIAKYSGSLNADVLKVGHHGSYTSTTKEFLSEIAPQYAVISCGVGNDYGHPNKSVIKRLSGVKILRTDELGSIVFTTDGNTLQYKTFFGGSK